ncbi:DUF2784 family protein [Algicola sagamiensis]|uniref:DUF2784 family protein n=1 Tax=Algicola sagamiensis TaxID=163869 RepID=UPI0012F8EE9E|nr:DUF2784 family protein [Algicola sagamiensis]
MKNRQIYHLLNCALHSLHLGYITFFLIGWLFPATHILHFSLSTLMIVFWYGLPGQYGAGFCPLTHIHWKIKDRYDQKPETKLYIKYMLDKAIREGFNERKVNYMTNAIAIGIYIISIIKLMLSFL